MKIKVKHHKCDMSKKDRDLMNNFIKFLQKNHPLKDDITIIFTGERIGEMSSGSRTEDSELKILTKGRMNRDIARTLAHEWVHEKQIKQEGKKPGQDIGGPLEDEANAKAGSLIKQFENDNPEKEEMMYESFNKKINLINEQILLTEKQNVRKEFLLEMKKIGIEKLPYSYSAMKQFVDPETMDIHYNKHYKGYVKKLNDALSKKNYKYEDLEDIIKSISKYDTKVRNNAGGAFNHALFWKMLSPTKQIPKGEIFEKITKQYGNIKKLKDQFNEVAKERFGSGWAWLVLTKTNRLKVISTPNQDNPLMNIIKDGGYPLLGLDLWEHAYYLRYRNKRDEYIKKFWNHINWEFVNDLYVSRTKKKLNESYFRVLTESEEFGGDLKKVMSRELQKIRLIPLDAEAANDAINNIIIAEIERGLVFSRTIDGLMTLDLSNVSERSKFRFNNYYQRFVRSRTRGYDFEGLISGLLGGDLSEGLSTPYDLTTPQNEKISCKIVRSTEEAVVLKGVSYSLDNYIKNYNGSEENKEELIQMYNSDNPIDFLIKSENQDFKNIAEDLIDNLLLDVDGMLLGIPNNEMFISLFYFDKEKLKNILKIPGMTIKPKTKGSTQIRFSTKILNLTDEVGPVKGQITFPTISQLEYSEFLIGDEKTKEILNMFNSVGDKYGVSGLGNNIPQDIIQKLSKSERFKFDLKRLLK
jgi:Fe-Mn family superoxide dismutase